MNFNNPSVEAVSQKSSVKVVTYVKEKRDMKKHSRTTTEIQSKELNETIKTTYLTSRLIEKF